MTIVINNVNIDRRTRYEKALRGKSEELEEWKNLKKREFWEEIEENVGFFYKVANHEHLDRSFEILNKLIEKKSEFCFVN